MFEFDVLNNIIINNIIILSNDIINKDQTRNCLTITQSHLKNRLMSGFS